MFTLNFGGPRAFNVKNHYFIVRSLFISPTRIYILAKLLILFAPIAYILIHMSNMGLVKTVPG